MKEERLSFFEWLAVYELTTEEEFKEIPKYKQENYKDEYKTFLKLNYN